MKNWKNPNRIALLALLAACVVAGLLPAIGFAGEDMGQPNPSVWLETPAALARTAAGDCNHLPGTRCVEECITMNGVPVPQDVFTCM